MEHHAAGVYDAELQGVARMAAAKTSAGRGYALTDTERMALSRHPDPPFLTIDGYRLRTGATA